MKHLLPLLILLPLIAAGQERVRIQKPANTPLRELSRLVSIDRVSGDTVYAYASAGEQQQLARRGIGFAPAPLPEPKAVNMATTIAQLREWNRYPTYDTYVQYMQQMATQHPTLCRLDTIGLSVQNRLILCMHIHGSGQNAPQFFYSSTIHGDEVTGYYFMLRLIDTLLSGYGHNPEITQLVDDVDIYINPLSNPDGTYHGGNNTLSGAQRYNANYVDLNRNYPCPFGVTAANPLQRENAAMIDYLSHHHFLLSANLHGGAEVMNYPWDSFESHERRHPQWQWWEQVCKRYVDTARLHAGNHFNDVTTSGYINGGDWYVISNGRQDYVNHFHNCLELTMEISSTKKLSSDLLPTYWNFQHRSLMNYIREILPLAPLPPSPDTVIVTDTIILCDTIHDTIILCDTTFIHDTLLHTLTPHPQPPLHLYPNPTHGHLFLENATHGAQLFDLRGRLLLTLPPDTKELDLRSLPSGLYLLRSGTQVRRILKL